MIGYSLSFYAKMLLLTFDLVQRQRKVKSTVTVREVDRYGPMINNSHGVFSLTFSPPRAKISGFNRQPIIPISTMHDLFAVFIFFSQLYPKNLIYTGAILFSGLGGFYASLGAAQVLR